MTKIDTRTKTEAQLRVVYDQLLAEYESYAKEAAEHEAELKSVRRDRDDVGERLADIANELARRTTPFTRGDIVEDDQGVRYRVHDVHFKNSRYTNYSGLGKINTEPGTVFGIRLLKNGSEAYAKAREIVASKPLRKVTE